MQIELRKSRLDLYTQALEIDCHVGAAPTTSSFSTEHLALMD